MAKKPEQPVSNVIRFPVEAVSRFGFKRSHVSDDEKSSRMEAEGQMNLFQPGDENDLAPVTRMGAVVPIPLQIGAFESAVLLDDNNDPRAEDAYRRAITEGDFVPDAWCNLGVLKSIKRDLDGAFECFAQSLASDPRHAESHYNIGNLYFEFGDLKLARMHYEKAIECDGDLASAYFNLGLVTALSEDYQTAYDSLAHYKIIAPPEEIGVADDLMRYLRSAINLS
ncbi:MAG TPA: tetratricopeptide repeat protein [Candidatus Krumholzibacteria bacterium]|nr:tetratricopeptide repeat protein [Candidatus Krumholzibacteria bacterium]